MLMCVSWWEIIRVGKVFNSCAAMSMEAEAQFIGLSKTVKEKLTAAKEQGRILEEEFTAAKEQLTAAKEQGRTHKE